MSRQPIEIKPMSPHTLKWWLNRQSSIDTSPSYQRKGRIWSDSDKAYLIDSILNGFDIPKIYLADFTAGDSPLNTAKLPYAIIDGKQRLEAVVDFFTGKIVLNDDFTLLEDRTLSLAGLGYKDLKVGFSEIAEKFDDFELSVMSVVTKDEELVNDLFVRLNRSKPLTGAEIRNAMKGPVPGLIRLVSDNEFFTSYIRFKILRGDDKNVAAKVLAFEYFEQLQSTKKSDLDGFVNRVDLDQERLERATWQAIDVFSRMTDIFLPQDRLLSSSGVVPVYYWFIRSLTESKHQFVRQFLISFEDQRTANRALVRDHPDDPNIDQQLSEYDQYNRSTNDFRSHRERTKILEARFARFVSTLKRKP
jgi:hypothetical protein